MTTLIPTVRLFCLACAQRYRATNPDGGRRCICGGELKRDTQTRADLVAAHGTPVQFGGACLRAYKDLLITGNEYDEAIARYSDEWKRAL